MPATASTKAAAARQSSPKSAKTPATRPGGLSALELHALVVAAKQAKPFRSEVPVGKAQPVSFRVSIRGEIDHAASQTSTTKEAPKLERCLALLFDALGPAARQRAFHGLTTRYHDADVAADTLDPQALHFAKVAVAQLTIEAEQPKAGNLTGRVTLRRLAS